MADYARISGQALLIMGESASDVEKIAGAAFQISAASQENEQKIYGAALQIFAIGPLLALSTGAGVLQGPLTTVVPELNGAQVQLQGGGVSAELDLDVED